MNDKLLERVTYAVQRMNEHEQTKRIVFLAVWLQDSSVKKFIDKFIRMDKSEVSERVLDLLTTIIVCAKTVYESDKYSDPFSDELYDKMLSKFKKFRPEPFGDNGTGLANARYKYDVLSGTLDKVHFIYNDKKDKFETRESLEDYIKGIPVGKDEEIVVLVNQKKDGTSVTFDYKLIQGRYVPMSAISRGKKDYGEGTDVSAVIPDNVSFPSNRIKEVLGYAPKYIGVQYEMLVSDAQKSGFEEFTNQTFANNRSAVAGLLRRIIFAKSKEAKQLRKFISLVPVGFDILDEYLEDKSFYKIKWSKMYKAVNETFIYGDIDMDYEIIKGTKKEILQKFEKLSDEWIKTRASLNHAIDGMVLTIVDRDLQRKLGRKNNINQYQIAFKFPEESGKTIVRDVIITTGNFGFKEMLLKVDPVILNGTSQGKAQVHSLNRFKEMNLRIGDEIILKLSGDVIPYGYKDDTCKAGTGEKIKFPTHCECGAKLVEEKNKYRCSDPNCPYRVSGSLVTFFVSLNAKGIGPRTCEQLHSELGVTLPSQVLQMKAKDFMKLEGFKEGAAQQCMKTIADILNKPRSVASIISALGIDTLRTSTASKLLDTVCVDKLISLCEAGDRRMLVSAIRTADGIDENATKIADGLISKCEELKRLLKLIPIKDEVSKDSLDKSILVSGMRNDEELIVIANKAGYAVKESGSKYDILVIRDETMMSASKAKFAMAHNRPIMTRKEFIAHCGKQ